MTTDPCVTHIAEKGEIFTLGDLVALVQAALKADFEPPSRPRSAHEGPRDSGVLAILRSLVGLVLCSKTPVYANVKLSVMIPAPVKTITIGNPNG